MNGIVKNWDEGNSCGSIQSNRKSYLVLRDDIQPDDAGRKFLIPNEPAAFDNHATRHDRAVNVIPDFRDSVSAEEAEVVTVYEWDSRNRSGWAKREVGGNLYCHANEIITFGEETIKTGTRLLCVAAPPQRSKDRCWRATQIEVFCPDSETNEFEKEK